MTNQHIIPYAWADWYWWAATVTRPSEMFRNMSDYEMQARHPQLFALKGVPQEPAWHPEGDVFEHTMHVADCAIAVADERELPIDSRVAVVLGSLGHDMGKPNCTVYTRTENDSVYRWRSPEHDVEGQPIAEAWMMNSLDAPEPMVIKVSEMARHHMFHVFLHVATRKIVRRRMNRLINLTSDELFAIIEADQRGRPGLEAWELEMPTLARECEAIWRMIEDEPEPLPPILTGKDLIGMGMIPGPIFGEILRVATEAHTAGRISTKAEAIEIARTMQA